MTLIIGINLSEKCYIAGDTRISYYENGQLRIRNDNVQKSEILKNSKGICVASAGDAAFAKYLLNKLSTSDFIKEEIINFRVCIEKWIGEICHEYFVKVGAANATLIFGGSDNNHKKEISGEQLVELLNAYTGGKGVVKLNKSLQEAFPEGKPIPKNIVELSIPHTGVFSVVITPDTLNFYDTKWGEFLLYGPKGIVKKDIGAKDIGTFEFDPTMQNNGSGVGNDQAMINAFIHSFKQKYSLDSVGGAVVIHENRSDGSVIFVTGDTYAYDLNENIYPNQNGKPTLISSIDYQGGTFYRIENKTRYKLTPVSEYKSSTEKLLLDISN